LIVPVRQFAMVTVTASDRGTLTPLEPRLRGWWWMLVVD
jgi:hypothetical protein